MLLVGILGGLVAIVALLQTVDHVKYLNNLLSASILRQVVHNPPDVHFDDARRVLIGGNAAKRSSPVLLVEAVGHLHGEGAWLLDRRRCCGRLLWLRRLTAIATVVVGALAELILTESRLVGE